MSNIVATPTRYNDNDILKSYFLEILEMKQSGVEYPANLDQVWRFVYTEKGKAVRSLNKEFIEGEDFEVIAQNGKNPQGGRPEIEYHLSLSCLEYFIARKVRRVFDVYRTVFHKIVSNPEPFTLPTTFADALRMLADKTEESERQQALLSEAQPKVEFYEAVTGSSDTVDLGTVAKTLNFKGIGRTKLFDLLRNEKVLMKNNIPMQYYQDLGWFRVIETTWMDKKGDQHIYFKTVVFQKGIDGIRKILTKQTTQHD